MCRILWLGMTFTTILLIVKIKNNLLIKKIEAVDVEEVPETNTLLCVQMNTVHTHICAVR